MIKKGAKLILRPPRHIYNLENIPPCTIFEGDEIDRTAVTFSNDRGDTLPGSYYCLKNFVPKENEKKTCIIYLHGNASNQLEGRFLQYLFIPVGISLFCFDFDGCGCSSGNSVSLGYYEQNDVKCAIEMLKKQFNIEQFLLWGRSMGAAVSIMVANQLKNDKCIKAIVADSAYSSVKNLVKCLGKERNVPAWIAKILYKRVRERIIKKNKFDLNEVSPVDSISNVTIPIFIIHGNEDHFVPKKNSELLYAQSPAKIKELRIVKGEHESHRPVAVLQEATVFLCAAAGIAIEFPEEEEDKNVDNEVLYQYSNQHYKDIDEMINACKNDVE